MATVKVGKPTRTVSNNVQRMIQRLCRESKRPMNDRSTEDREDLELRRYDLLLGVRRSVRYHDHRRRFYLGVQAWINFANVALGSAAAAQFFVTLGAEWVQLGFPAVIALLSALSLVVGVSDKAAQHFDLYRRFIRLERRFLGAPLDTPTLDRLEDKRLAIEMDEPSDDQALDVACHNELVRSEGRPELMEPLRLHHRLLKGVFRFAQLPLAQRDKVA